MMRAFSMITQHSRRSFLAKVAQSFALGLIALATSGRTTAWAEGSRRIECPACQFNYNPDIGDRSQGIPPGTAFEDLPDDWICPDCGTPKSEW